MKETLIQSSNLTCVDLMTEEGEKSERELVTSVVHFHLQNSECGQLKTFLHVCTVNLQIFTTTRVTERKTYNK